MGLRDYINKWLFKEVQQKNYKLTDIAALRNVFPQWFGSKDYYNSFTYTCINLRAEKLSLADVCLFEKIKKEETEIENETEPFIKLISQVNNQNLAFENILFLISACLDFYGRAFLLIDRNGLGVPINLQFAYPNYVRIIYDSTNSVITGYEVNYTNGKKILPTEDVIFFNLPDLITLGGFKATIQALDGIVDINNLRKDFQKNFFINNARIDGFLKSKVNLSDEQFEKLKASWKSQYSGGTNSGKTPLLESDID